MKLTRPRFALPDAVPPTVPRKVPRAVLRVLQLAVTVGLLAWLWRAVDGPQAVHHLVAANPVWLVAAALALTLQTVLSALRWQMTAQQLGIVLDRWTALREYYLSQFVNQTLPGGVLGDAGRAVRTRAQAGLMSAGQAVVFERLAGQVALFAVFAAAFLLTYMVPGGLDWPRWLLPPVMVFVLGGLALPAILWAGIRLLPEPMTPGMGKGFLKFARAFAHALAAPAVRWPQLWLSLGTALCNIAAFAFCAYAVGSDIVWTTMFALVPLILFTMIVPVTVSGWGLREGAAAMLFPVAGASASEGLATSVAFGLVFLALVLPGLLLLGLKPPPATTKS